ncbi:hypothetical protein GCM10009022_21600 [Vreelandella titanicae]
MTITGETPSSISVSAIGKSKAATAEDVLAWVSVEWMPEKTKKAIIVLNNIR